MSTIDVTGRDEDVLLCLTSSHSSVQPGTAQADLNFMRKKLFLTRRTLATDLPSGKNKKKVKKSKYKDIKHAIICAFANGKAILDDLDEIQLRNAFVVSV